MSNIEWTDLRSWNGSQREAFEELCCQLASTEPVPTGAVFVRKGVPDAGVECFWRWEFSEAAAAGRRPAERAGIVRRLIDNIENVAAFGAVLPVAEGVNREASGTGQIPENLGPSRCVILGDKGRHIGIEGSEFLALRRAKFRRGFVLFEVGKFGPALAFAAINQFVAFHFLSLFGFRTPLGCYT